MDPSHTADTLTDTADNVLPLIPTLTPASGVAGAILILTGLAYCIIGTKINMLHVAIPSALLVSIGVTALVILQASLPVSHATQGAYLVAIVCPSVLLGAIGWALSQATECLGCLLGGFCIAMWIETLRSGGVLQSPSLPIFLAVVSLTAFGVVYIPKYGKRIREKACIGFSAFSGATAIVLGVDCFTCAGYKEFWMYTWDIRRTDIFPFGTDTYPMTKAIQAEIGCIVVLCVFGMISQVLTWEKNFPTFNKFVKNPPEISGPHADQERGDALEIVEVDTRDPSSLDSAWTNKKAPNVQQTQVSPESPSQDGPPKSYSAAKSVHNRSESNPQTLVATDDTRQQDDDIRPVEEPTANMRTMDTSDTQLPSTSQNYPTLRPTSLPPRPIPLQSDKRSISSTNNVDYVNVNTSTSWHMLDERVSSLGLEEFEKKSSSSPIDEQSNQETSSQVEPNSSQLDAFDFERISSGDEGNRNSIQKTDPEDQNEEEEPDALRVSSNSTDDDGQAKDDPPRHLKRTSKSSNLLQEAALRGREESVSLAVLEEKRREAMERTKEWAEMLYQAEPEPSESTMPTCDFEEGASLWSGFEGTHATHTTAEVGYREQRPHPTLKHEKREPRRASATESKAVIRPKLGKSARVRERNATLPVLRTGPTIDEQQAVSLEQREQHFAQFEQMGAIGSGKEVVDESLRRPDGNDGMTLAERRVSLQAARRVSSGQVSTQSSQLPRSSHSMSIQSPIHTTAMTTPTTSSPTHPPFQMAALPLRCPYPPPPGGMFDAAALHQSRFSLPGFRMGAIDIPTNHLEGSPRPAIQHNGILSPHTARRPSMPVASQSYSLVNEIERHERRLTQQREEQRKSQARVAAESAQRRKHMEDHQKRLKAEEAMRRGDLNNAHQDALRKMQRQALKNTTEQN